MIVYKKKSTYKGAEDGAVWYSATRADGKSVSCVFCCDIPDDIKRLGAFEISNAVGTSKVKTTTVKGKTYENYTYYIEQCDFAKIPPSELPM